MIDDLFIDFSGVFDGSSWFERRFGKYFGRRKFRRQEKKALLAQQAYVTGKPVPISAGARGISRRMSGWIDGVLDVEPGLLTWYGGRKGTIGVPIAGGRVVVGEVCDPDPKETWNMNLLARIIPLEMDGRSVELAVMPYDLHMVLAALDGRECLGEASSKARIFGRRNNVATWPY